MNILNIPVDVNQILFFLKQQLPYSERKRIAKLLTKKESEISLKESKFTEKKKMYFTVLSTDIKYFKFDNDEAIQRLKD